MRVATRSSRQRAARSEVAGDHGGLERPAVDEDAGEDAEQGDGEQVGDLQAGDLLRGAVELEGEDADDGEEGEEVAEDGDDLGVPEAAHRGDAQDGAHREGSATGVWGVVAIGEWYREGSGIRD